MKNLKKLKNNFFNHFEKTKSIQYRTIEPFTKLFQISNPEEEITSIYINKFTKNTIDILFNIIFDKDNVEPSALSTISYSKHCLNVLHLFTKLPGDYFSFAHFDRLFSLLINDDEISQNLGFYLEKILINYHQKSGNNNIVPRICSYILNSEAKFGSVITCLKILCQINIFDKIYLSKKIKEFINLPNTKIITERIQPINYDLFFAYIARLIEVHSMKENILDLKVIALKNLIDTKISSEYDEILLKLGGNVSISDPLVRKCKHCEKKIPFVVCRQKLMDFRVNVVKKYYNTLMANKNTLSVIQKLRLCNSIVSHNDCEDINSPLFRIGLKTRIELYKLLGWNKLCYVDNIMLNGGYLGNNCHTSNLKDDLDMCLTLERSFAKVYVNECKLIFEKKVVVLFKHEAFSKKVVSKTVVGKSSNQPSGSTPISPLNLSEWGMGDTEILKDIYDEKFNFKIDYPFRVFLEKGDSFLLGIDLKKNTSNIYQVKDLSCFGVKDDLLILSGSKDYLIKLFDLKKNKIIKLYKNHPYPIRCIAQNKNLIALSCVFFILIWDTAKNKVRSVSGYKDTRNLKFYKDNLFIQHKYYIIQFNMNYDDIEQCTPGKFYIDDQTAAKNESFHKWNFTVNDCFLITYSSNYCENSKSYHYKINVFNKKTTDLLKVIDFDELLKKNNIIPEYYYNPLYYKEKKISLDVIDHILLLNYSEKILMINLQNCKVSYFKDTQNLKIMFLKAIYLPKNQIDLFYVTSQDVKNFKCNFIRYCICKKQILDNQYKCECCCCYFCSKNCKQRYLRAHKRNCLNREFINEVNDVEMKEKKERRNDFVGVKRKRDDDNDDFKKPEKKKRK